MAFAARPLARTATLRPIFGLPPALRQSLYQQHQQHSQNGVRHFSIAGISASMESADYVALVPASAMEALHTVGLPWWAVFPVSAVLIRSFFVYPLFQKRLRKAQIERLSIRPLLDARLGQERLRLARKHQPGAKQRFAMVRASFFQNYRLARDIFGQEPLWMKRAASFFTLMAVSDSIRRLSGHKEGLLKLLLGPFDWVAAAILGPDSSLVKSAPETTTTATTASSASASSGTPVQSHPMGQTTPQDMMEEPWKTQQITPPDTAIGTSASSAITDTTALPTNPPPNINVDSPWFEPSLLTDGLPFCTDLTAPDPTLILPFLFSTSFFLSIYLSPRIAGNSTSATPKATNFQRIGMTLAMLSIFPALKMPAALLLYFVTNIWVGALQARWLVYRMPFRRVPTACRRPVRTQPMREMRDEFSEVSARTAAGRVGK